MTFFQVRFYDHKLIPYWALEALFTSYNQAEDFIDRNEEDCIIPVVEVI